MPDSGDLLLFALSAWREASWSAFRNAFDGLYLRRIEAGEEAESEPIQHLRWRAALVLDVLGHCDVASGPEGRRLYAAPAALAALPVPGLPRAVLCGARSPATAAEVEQACIEFAGTGRVTMQPQNRLHPYAPSRIEVEADSDQALRRLAEMLGLMYISAPAAWRILELSPSVDEYIASLEWTREPEVNWPRRDFDRARLRFSNPAASSEGSGLRLSSYTHPGGFRWLHRLWQNGSSANADPAWARYAVLKAAQEQVLLYDPRRGTVAVPRGTPLPRLLARGLALCSGSAPAFIPRDLVRQGSPEQHGFDRYAGVPPDVFAVVAAKLGQRGRPATLPPDEGSCG
jgi:hypothetical protein